MKRRRQRAPKQSKSASPIKGLWRDRNFLVVDLRDHQFPPRCVKSNLPCDLPATPVSLSTETAADFDVDPLAVDERLTERVRVTYRRHSSNVELRLRIPLRPGWRRLITWPWGTRLAMAGGFGVVLSFFAAWLAPTFPDWLHPRIWGRMILVSLAVAFLGLFIRLCLSWLLPIRRIEEKMVWLGGVHREWLRLLPEFVPSSKMLIRELEVANWKFWPTLGVGLMLVGLSFITILTLKPDLLSQVLTAVYLLGIAVVILRGNATSSHILRTRKRLDELYLSRIRRRRRP